MKVVFTRDVSERSIELNKNHLANSLFRTRPITLRDDPLGLEKNSTILSMQ